MELWNTWIMSIVIGGNELTDAQSQYRLVVNHASSEVRASSVSATCRNRYFAQILAQLGEALLSDKK